MTDKEPVASMVVPRIRGNAIKVGKQWGFELYISVGEDDPICMAFVKDPYLFINREAALLGLRKAAVEVLEVVCAAAGAPKPDSLIDLNKGGVYEIDEWKNRGKSR